MGSASMKSMPMSVAADDNIIVSNKRKQSYGNNASHQTLNAAEEPDPPKMKGGTNLILDTSPPPSDELKAKKKEILVELEKSIKLLCSEENWFDADSEVEEKITEALDQVHMAYFDIDLPDTPYEFLLQFRRGEVAVRLTNAKLVTKIALFVSKILNIDKTGNKCQYPLELSLLILMNYSDLSEDFAIQLANSGEFLVAIAAVLEGTYQGHLDWEKSIENSEDAWGPHFLEMCFSCIHNCAMVEDNVHTLREHNFIEIIKPYLKSPNGGFKLMALATLADLINEKESEMLKTNTESVKFLLNRFCRALDMPNKRFESWRSDELCRAVRQIARHDANKKLLVELGVLPLLLKMGTNGDVTEQREAVQAIWVLSFDNQNRTKICEDKAIMDMLTTHKNSPDAKIRKSCNGALWTLKHGEDQAQNGKSVTSKMGGKAGLVGHVMISYQWANQKVLVKVRDVLKANGFKVWMDIDEMEGSTLQAMAEAVEQAAAVLVCMSQKYKDSPNCRAEAEYSFQKRKKIVPLLLERGYKPDGWLGFIAGAKLFFDFSGKYPFEEKASGLVKELQPHLDTENNANLPDVVVAKDMTQKIPFDSTDGPLTYASTSKSLHSVKQWTRQDVSKWADTFGLPSPFSTLTGKAVAMLVQMQNKAPEFFFHGLKKDFKINDYNVMAQVVEALESLEE